MIRHGIAPFLECSSHGDRRFSAFYAIVRRYSIEQRYQSGKLFDEDPQGFMNWRKAKGRKATNQHICTQLYSDLWDEYIEENPHLLDVLKKATGLSDIFGQEGHCCQATELWRIRNE